MHNNTRRKKRKTFVLWWSLNWNYNKYNNQKLEFKSHTCRWGDVCGRKALPTWRQVSHFALLIHTKLLHSLWGLLFFADQFWCSAVKAHSCCRGTLNNPPTHLLTHPAASWETKQLTCCNLHVVLCFCPGSFCKTWPSLRCSGTAVVLREAGKTQQTVLYSH